MSVFGVTACRHSVAVFTVLGDEGIASPDFPEGSHTVTAHAAPPVAHFVLDISIVETGPSKSMLLEDTDDSCDTQKEGDC
jgi:FxLD family lantipeptide